MEVNGLPAHVLVIHAAVIFGPLAASLALAYVALPRWRDLLRWPMVALAVGAAGLIVAAYFSGKDFFDSRPDLGALGPVRTHADRGEYALWATLAFAVVAVAAGLLHDRRGPVRIVLGAVLAVGAIIALATIVLAGDSGAQAVWGA